MSAYKFGPILVALAAILWAVDAPFRTHLARGLSSTAIVLMEHVVIAVLVLIFLARYFKEFKNLSAKEWMAVIFIGFGGSGLATVLFTQSFQAFDFMPTVPILLQKVQPIFAFVLAAVFLKEKLRRSFWIWAIVAIFGAYLVTYPDAQIEDFSLNGRTLGAAFALGAAFLWGASTVFGRLVLKKVSFQAMTALRFLSALIFLLFLNIQQGTLGQVRGASARDWQYVFIIAVIAGFISLFIYYYGLRSTKASIATLCELAFPFSAVIVNWKFLGSKLDIVQIVGGLILLGSVIALSWVNEKPEMEAKPGQML